MASSRCAECNASITLPVELEATTMRCGYCDTVEPVPDLAQRRAVLAERRAGGEGGGSVMSC